MIKVSAPGKLMLFGEHAVVYGKPCIVTAVDQRVTVQADFNGENELIVSAPQVGINNYHCQVGKLCCNEMPKEVSFIEAGVKQFYWQFGLKKGLNIRTKSSFSQSLGFGSSSAITIATCKALSLLYKVKLTEKQIFDLSYKAVLAIQGVGSGFDLAAALWGKTLYFEKGAKKVEKLGLKSLPLIVCNSGIKADTPTLVRQVAELRTKKPKKINKIFRQMEVICTKAKRSILLLNWQSLGILMIENQQLLQSLGVSTNFLEKLIQAALKSGAWGAKLSGAGGGDNIIVLGPENKRKRIEMALEKAGGKVIKVKLNAPGVMIEN